MTYQASNVCYLTLYRKTVLIPILKHQWPLKWNKKPQNGLALSGHCPLLGPCACLPQSPHLRVSAAKI